jgi:hypothetical protein
VARPARLRSEIRGGRIKRRRDYLSLPCPLVFELRRKLIVPVYLLRSNTRTVDFERSHMIDSAGGSTHMEFNYLQVLHFSMWRVHCVLLFCSLSAFTVNNLYFWKGVAWIVLRSRAVISFRDLLAES